MYKLEIGTSEEPGVKLRVYARLAGTKTEGKFSGSLVVKTRFNRPDDKKIHRDYSYAVFPSRPISGEDSRQLRGQAHCENRHPWRSNDSPLLPLAPSPAHTSPKSLQTTCQRSHGNRRPLISR